MNKFEEAFLSGFDNGLEKIAAKATTPTFGQKYLSALKGEGARKGFGKLRTEHAKVQELRATEGGGRAGGAMTKAKKRRLKALKEFGTEGAKTIGAYGLPIAGTATLAVGAKKLSERDKK